MDIGYGTVEALVVRCECRVLVLHWVEGGCVTEASAGCEQPTGPPHRCRYTAAGPVVTRMPVRAA